MLQNSDCNIRQINLILKGDCKFLDRLCISDFLPCMQVILAMFYEAV